MEVEIIIITTKKVIINKINKREFAEAFPRSGSSSTVSGSN